MKNKPFTNAKVRSLKKKSKVYREHDYGGLYLEVAVSGSKIWKQRYNFEQKQVMITIGHYPHVSLLDARQAVNENKQLLVQGIDPRHKNIKSSKPTFNEMFNKWHNQKCSEWSDNYAYDVKQRADCYLIPIIGRKPIDKITTPDMLALLKKIEEKGVLDTLRKIKGIASRTFSFSVGMGEITVNPVRDLPMDIFKRRKQVHYPTFTDPKDIGQLLRTLDCHKGTYQVRAALEIAPHIFLRPGELTKLIWDYVDFSDRIIRVDKSIMKMKRDHLVPMSNQVFDMLKDLSRIESGSKYIFPSLRNKNKGITTNALLSSIRSLGINSGQFVTHGFRGMASSFLHEKGFVSDVIERQLAHVEANKVKAAYCHAEYLEQRIVLMQAWSNYLDDLKSNVNLTKTIKE